MKNMLSKVGKQQPGRLAPPGFPMLLLLLLFSVPAHAAGKGSDEISLGEIALYVVLIAGVMAVAWFLTMGGKKTQPPTHHHTGAHHHHHHKGHHRHHRR